MSNKVKPKPFITCHLKGGLGNQLFQIFNAMRNALKYKGRFIFTNETIISGSVNRPTYWSNLLDTLQPYVVPINYSHFKTVIREKDFEYKCLDEDFLSIMANNDEYMLVLFDGYFQSPKYFDEYFNEICHFLRIAEKQDMMQKTLLMMDSMNVDLTNTVSMHFRLGDYKFLPNHHPVLKKEYYVNALKHISLHSPKTITHVLYFYQEDDAKEVEEFISALKEMFTNIQFTSILSLSCTNILVDWEQMLAMSCCGHHIIANSTFSWWGAYLSKLRPSYNFNKIVCYPSIWFGPALKHHDTTDLFPSDWTKINANC